jgi:sporulation protein YlmC with PRC-barrel domain
VPHPVIDDAQTWVGLQVIDSNGANVGTVSQIYIDETTDRPK